MAARRGIVCFGELLLRLGAPGRERLLQSRRLDVHVGGAEANVAVSLARFGHKVRMVSILAGNALGDETLGELRRHGVDTSFTVRAPGRMGLYFLSHGAVRRPSEILYDRAASAFALAAPDTIDWPRALKGRSWFHLSGVTPAIGPGAAEAALRAVRAARGQGLNVSFDGNYRAGLWAAWPGDGPAILREILGHAEIAFINERDIALILGRSFGADEAAARKTAFAAAFAAFPDLQLIAATARRQESVERHLVSAELVTRSGAWRSRVHDLSGVVDRIGAGDAFAAGVLHGLMTGRGRQYAVDFGAAAAALKHSIPGDMNIASVADVEAAMTDQGLDVRR